jgi:hypothetical protein
VVRFQHKVRKRSYLVSLNLSFRVVFKVAVTLESSLDQLPELLWERSIKEMMYAKT